MAGVSPGQERSLAEQAAALVASWGPAVRRALAGRAADLVAPALHAGARAQDGGVAGRRPA
jgi:hypothetical protein